MLYSVGAVYNPPGVSRNVTDWYCNALGVILLGHVCENQNSDFLQVKKSEIWCFANKPGSHAYGKDYSVSKMYIPPCVSSKMNELYCNVSEHFCFILSLVTL